MGLRMSRSFIFFLDVCGYVIHRGKVTDFLLGGNGALAIASQTGFSYFTVPCNLCFWLVSLAVVWPQTFSLISSHLSAQLLFHCLINLVMCGFKQALRFQLFQLVPLCLCFEVGMINGISCFGIDIGTGMGELQRGGGSTCLHWVSPLAVISYGTELLSAHIISDIATAQSPGLHTGSHCSDLLVVLCFHAITLQESTIWIGVWKRWVKSLLVWTFDPNCTPGFSLTWYNVKYMQQKLNKHLLPAGQGHCQPLHFHVAKFENVGLEIGGRPNPEESYVTLPVNQRLLTEPPFRSDWRDPLQQWRMLSYWDGRIGGMAVAAPLYPCFLPRAHTINYDWCPPALQILCKASTRKIKPASQPFIVLSI